MPLAFVKLSESSELTKLAVIEIVAPARLVLSMSLAVIVLDTDTAGPVAENESAEPSVPANTGASLTAPIVTFRVAAVLLVTPSLTWKLIVRVVVLGLSLLFA